MPIETKIAPVDKSYSALDFRADVVVCVNDGAKVYKLLDNIEIIAVSRDLTSFTPSPIFADSRSIALNAAVTSRIVRPMMSMSSAYARSRTLL